MESGTHTLLGSVIVHSICWNALSNSKCLNFKILGKNLYLLDILSSTKQNFLNNSAESASFVIRPFTMFFTERGDYFQPVDSRVSFGGQSIQILAKRNSTNFTMSKSKTERTYIMVKPDGVQRGLIGEIIKRFEQKGFKLVAMKFMQPDEELLSQHYADLKSKPFFPGLVKFMATSPVCCMVRVLLVLVFAAVELIAICANYC